MIEGLISIGQYTRIPIETVRVTPTGVQFVSAQFRLWGPVTAPVRLLTPQGEVMVESSAVLTIDGKWGDLAQVTHTFNLTVLSLPDGSQVEARR